MSRKRKERRERRRKLNRHKFYTKWECFVEDMDFNLVTVGITGFFGLSVMFLAIGLFVGTIQYEVIPQPRVANTQITFLKEKTNLIPQPMAAFVTCTMNDRTFWHSPYEVRNLITNSTHRQAASITTVTFEAACKKDSSSPLCRPYRNAPGIWALTGLAIYLHFIIWIGITIPVTKYQGLKNIVMFSSLILLLVFFSIRLGIWNTRAFYSACTEKVAGDPFPFAIQHNSTLTDWTGFRYDSRLLGFQSANFLFAGFMLIMYGFGILIFANDQFDDLEDNPIVLICCLPWLLLFLVGALVSGIFAAGKDIACLIQGGKWDIVTAKGDCTFCQHRTEPWFLRFLCWPLFILTFPCRQSGFAQFVGHTDGPLDDYVQPSETELASI